MIGCSDPPTFRVILVPSWSRLCPCKYLGPGKYLGELVLPRPWKAIRRPPGGSPLRVMFGQGCRQVRFERPTTAQGKGLLFPFFFSWSGLDSHWRAHSGSSQTCRSVDATSSGLNDQHGLPVLVKSNPRADLRRQFPGYSPLEGGAKLGHDICHFCISPLPMDAPAKSIRPERLLLPFLLLDTHGHVLVITGPCPPADRVAVGTRRQQG